MKKKINTNDELKVKQINPKFRTFLFMLCNWLWFPFLWLFIGGEDPYFFKISVIYNHEYLGWIFFGCYVVFFFYSIWWSNYIGIKYLPRDMTDYYLRKNNNNLNNNSNLKVNEVTNLFNVTPICEEVYFKSKKVKTIDKDTFVKLSLIEKSKNRLVVNGKIDNNDFSWGIISKVNKVNFKVFLKTILYFGPIIGILRLLIPVRYNRIYSNDISTKISRNFAEYKKLGCGDLVAKNLGQVNSESYLIFAAKLKNSIDAMTLVPKTNDVTQNSDLENEYDWPKNLSSLQKKTLQDLIETFEFLPSIYVSQDDISIVMKKYHHNQTDDAQFETWELLKQEDSNSGLQFKYLENAVKIYNIFNLKNDVSKKGIE